ncbi:LamB/YcsF family protein [Paenibacillus sacheonensis]|uniref:LamB/YcsF family protein n=1 Tax=Paenibacillus sacheonensis TaxID=742054 RepID=UPI001EF8426E|nr:5-oxoprolinase subunit PxpA [Paenibacillus sacheonensis]
MNCDFGESYGTYTFGQDEALLAFVTSVNIACGFHAGDPHTIREAAERAVAAGAAIGAHPGLPDRLGFGRREMALAPQDVYDYTLYQIGALEGFVRAAGGRLHHVKPHGALYHMAGRSPELADAFVRAVRAFDPELMLYAQWGSALLAEADRQGLRRAAEIFADRTYRTDGSLTPRSEPNAVHLRAEDALAQTITIITEGHIEIGGARIPMQGDTVCLHGDGPHAAAFAARLHEGLLSANIELRPPHRP